jgi:hypothetical protein
MRDPVAQILHHSARAPVYPVPDILAWGPAGTLIPSGRPRGDSTASPPPQNGQHLVVAGNGALLRW